HCCWVDRGGYREISDARAHDDLLDNRARHHRVDHRRSGYPHVFAPGNRTISSRRPHFFHTWRDPGSLRCHQAEYPFSPRSLIRKEENCFVSRRSYRNVNEPALRIVHGVELKARRIKETDSPSAILSGFVAVLFSEIVSAKCKNALPGV